MFLLYFIIYNLFRMEDFVCGLIAGSIGSIISYPFDTIKTNIQSGLAKNIKEAIKYNCNINNNINNNYIIKNLIKNLYKGCIIPTFGIGFEKFLVFGIYNEFKKQNHHDIICGLIAGFTSTLIVVPIDRIKIMMQNKEIITKNLFMPKSLYKGFSITLFRETPGFGIYFTTYNKLNYYNENKNLTKSFIFGSISGLVSWIFIYPSDLIKTKYQSIKTTNTFNNPTNNNNIIFVIKNIYKTNGLFGFYKGFNLALLRALPLHGGVFWGYEFSKKMFNSEFNNIF